jgi:predicted transcriptional regulator
VSTDNLRVAINTHVASILKEQREKQKISLGELARKAGLARQTIAFVEREVQSPSLDTLLRMVSVLNIDLHEVIARAYKRARKGNVTAALQTGNRKRQKTPGSLGT